MRVTRLIQIGEIYLFLSKEWQNATVYITVKNGREIPFNKVLVDSTLKVDSIYRYLLENWTNRRLQIFYSET